MSPPTDGPSWPAARQAWYATFVLMVAYTLRRGNGDAEKVRLISARRASRRERAAYDAHD